MAEQKNPAGVRLLVYGMGKGKGGIEGFERVGVPLKCNDLLLRTPIDASQTRLG